VTVLTARLLAPRNRREPGADATASRIGGNRNLSATLAGASSSEKRAEDGGYGDFVRAVDVVIIDGLDLSPVELAGEPSTEHRCHDTCQVYGAFTA